MTNDDLDLKYEAAFIRELAEGLRNVPWDKFEADVLHILRYVAARAAKAARDQARAT